MKESFKFQWNGLCTCCFRIALNCRQICFENSIIFVVEKKKITLLSSSHSIGLEIKVLLLLHRLTLSCQTWLHRHHKSSATVAFPYRLLSKPQHPQREISSHREHHKHLLLLRPAPLPRLGLQGDEMEEQGEKGEFGTARARTS